MSLVITFAPHPDESGFGYYRRLAVENSLWGWKELAAVANIHGSRSALLSRPEYTSTAFGLNLEWTQAAYDQEALARTWRFFHRRNVDAVCPICLQEANYLRQHWEHTYVTCCPRHRVRLVDRCDACGKPIAHKRERIDYCTCGHNLRDSTTKVATHAELWLSTLITSNGASSGPLLPKIRNIKVDTLCLLIRDLCLFTDPNTPPPSRSAGSANTVGDAVELLAPLDLLLADWPEGFKRHISMRIATGKPNARTLNILLGSWYIGLRKRCQGTTLEPFLKAVLDVAAQEFDGVLGMDTSIYKLADTIEYIRLPDAAKIIGVSRDHLHKAMMKGDIPYRTRLPGTRGILYEMPKLDAQRIAKDRLYWIAEREAAELAGVGETVMHSMVEAAVVNFDAQWRSDIMKAGPINSQSIDDLYSLLIRQMKRTDFNQEEVVFWADLLSRRWGSNAAIQATMQAAKRGDLRAIVKGPSIGKMGFLRSEVGQYFGVPVLESGMSLSKLAKVTGWHSETLRYWIDEGLLQCEQVKLPGQQRHVILPEHLLQFRRTYVPVADLAKALNKKASSLTRDLNGVLEVIGAQPLPNGYHRGGLLRVVDLGRLALEQIMANPG